MGKGNSENVYLIGGGAVASNGVGEHFYEAFQKGTTGIFSLNKVGKDNAKYIDDLRGEFVEYTRKNCLPKNHPINKFINIYGDGGIVAEERQALLNRCRATETATISYVEDGKKHTVIVDMMGVIPDEQTLCYALPLFAALIKKFGPGNLEQQRSDPHINEFVFLQLPRMSYLAVLSTFLGLIDIAGDLPAFHEEIDQVEFDPEETDLLPEYLDDTIPIVEKYLKRALETVHWARGKDGKKLRIGIYTASSTGNLETKARFAIRLSQNQHHNRVDFKPHPKEGKKPEIKVPAMEKYIEDKFGMSIGESTASEVDDFVRSFEKIERFQIYNEVQQSNEYYTAGLLARAFEFSGEQLMVSTSCCSGSSAAIAAQRVILSGDADVMFVTGADCCLWSEMFSPFSALSQLAHLKLGEDPKTVSRPYDNQAPGWVISEASGTVVLASKEVASLLGRKEVRWCKGKGQNRLSPPAFDLRQFNGDYREKYLTRVDLLEEVLQPLPIKYSPGLVVGYGLGSPHLDKHELSNLQEAFKTQNITPSYLYSIKERIGHSMAGSSALSLLFGYWALKEKPLIHSNIKPIEGLDSLSTLTSKQDISDIDWVLVDDTGLGSVDTAILLLLDNFSEGTPIE